MTVAPCLSAAANPPKRSIPNRPGQIRQCSGVKGGSLDPDAICLWHAVCLKPSSMIASFRWRTGVILASCIMSLVINVARASTHDMVVGDEARPDWLSRRATPAMESATPVNGRRAAIRSVFSLAVILVGLGGLHYAVRRRALKGWTPGGPWAPRILSRRRLGARQELVTVQWHGRELLLGVTAGAMSVLDRGSRMDDAEQAPAPTLTTEASEARVEGV